MRVVLLLHALAAGRAEIVTTHGYHVVAAVRRGFVDRLVLAH